ncbi:glycoside hydrolase family 3 N-terminal domain-containing protein, partial [Streptomyces sp. NPDC127074]|uniref:glycoside hydrolase family 3 N-terminal domain-containing protein n=1 Tax=Streptomyces sp. NPDC127074 TaxID=3347130 RepID=UPI00364E21C9
MEGVRVHTTTSRRALLTATLAAAAAGACSAPTNGSPAPAAPARHTTAGSGGPSPTPSRATTQPGRDQERDRRRIDELIGRMTLDQKIGQLFVMRVYGHSATHPDPADVAANRKDIGVDNAAELIAKYHVGGVMYIGWAHNIRDPHQVAALSGGIQKAALAASVPVPVLLSTDQEYGTVARVGAPATLFPGAMALGAGGSPADARTAPPPAGAVLAPRGQRPAK